MFVTTILGNIILKTVLLVGIFLDFNIDFLYNRWYSLITMKLFTDEINKALKKAGADNIKPIIKLFTPWANCTWLVTGEEDGILYGFADLGMDCVEFGSLFTREEVEDIEGPAGLKIERDLYWNPKPDVDYFKLDSLMGV